MNAWCVSDCASLVLTRHLTLPHVHSLHCKLIHCPDVGINAKWMTYTETLFVLLSGGTDRQWEDRGIGVTKSTRSCWLFLNVALCIFIQLMSRGPRSLPSYIHAFLGTAANDRLGHGGSLCVTKYRPLHRLWKTSSDFLHSFSIVSVKFCSVGFRFDTDSLFLVLGAAASCESSWTLKVQGTRFIYLSYNNTMRCWL